MPTYDYACAKCGPRFEQIQRISDPPLKTCPKCRGGLKRLIHGGVGIIFKGSGFYVTDSRSRPSKSGGEEKTKESATTTAKQADKVSGS
jgi:putative FmdB family regulatory protein